ncbi:M23 family metallopeptidase [Corynebacterium auriscanis]|uniref:M23 family metallopeptidase n=1 Tax=Corynebacterium auriscanis TaxID=99807 RepID=UPI003CF33AA5
MRTRISAILCSLFLAVHAGVAETAPHRTAPPLVRIHRVPVAGIPVSADPATYVLKPADIPEQNWRPGHRGVDIKALPGDKVVASATGIVAFAGVVAGTPVVSVDHHSGVRTTYEPVRAVVRAGTKVRRGQVVGTLADTNKLPQTARRDPGLSWGAKAPGGGSARWVYVDPMELLGPAVVRLIPEGSQPAGVPD